MHFNADFSKRAAVHANRQPWTPSLIKGVERRMLDRIGGEVARATSIVRYAPESRFSAHTHGGGEEFIVLEGVFQVEHGDFPAGTYVRNPPTTAHTPRSETGCILFVKLWQFDGRDRNQLRIDTNAGVLAPEAGRDGVSLLPLFQDAREVVRIEQWQPGANVALALPGGGEFLVLSGSFVEGQENFEPHSWLRLPAGARLSAVAGQEGALLWVKTGHLAHAPERPAAA